MKPLIQTITEPGRGNCLAAAIACILEVPVESIPDLDCGRNHDALEAFLGMRGLVPVWIHAAELAKRWVGYHPEFCVLIGDSPRRTGVRHAVVGKPDGYGYSIVHDPHPEGGGLAGDPVAVIYFGVLDPTQPRGDLCESRT